MSGKRCSGCGEVKAVESFSRDRSRKDGRGHRCKACARRHYVENREARLEYQRRHYEENREADMERSRRWHEENREAALERQRRNYEENREEILENKRRYYEEHREVLTESFRRYKKAMRDMTREVATRNGERYTPEEDAHILASDEPAAAIAVDLGRTMVSVHNRRSRLRKAVSA